MVFNQTVIIITLRLKGASEILFMLGPKIFGGLLLSPNIGSVFEFAEVFCFYLGSGVGLGLRLGFGVVLG